MIRALTQDDGPAALILYNELTSGPPATDLIAFERVISHTGTSILGAFEDDQLVAMLTLHILPNVTMNSRPYALIENVITAKSHRRRGLGTELLKAAEAHAWRVDCYKIMLLTGVNRAVEEFYRAAGFSSFEKTAMVLRRT